MVGRKGGRARRAVIGFVILCLLGTGVVFGPTVLAWAYEAISTTFWSGTTFYASRAKVVTGDFDGDGITDVMQLYRGTYSTSSSKFYLYTSDGEAMSRAYAASWSKMFSKTQIAAGDYDDDGMDDIFLLYNRGYNTSSVYVMLSDGSGLGAATEIYRSPVGKLAFSRSKLTAGDVNGDGEAEAVIWYASSTGASSIRVIGKPAPVTTDSKVYGTVVAAVGGLPLSGIGVTLYDSGGAVLGTDNTDASGNYEIACPEGTGYHAVFSATDYMTATYYNIAPSGAAGISLQAVMCVPAGSTGPGNASGTITNAFTGTGVSGLSVVLHAGYNNPSGATVGSPATTGASGDYTFTGVPGGYYTAVVTGGGYATTNFTVVVVGGTTVPNQNMSISPVLSGGEMRIVLTWGENPYDLDSHLTGPDGSSRFHVYFSSKTFSSPDTSASLDVDDRVSYGPETITISRMASTGVYRYSVYDWSNGGGTSGNALALSGAQVRVYTSAGLVATYNVPNHAGGLWKVFEMTSGVITSVNTVESSTSVP